MTVTRFIAALVAGMFALVNPALSMAALFSGAPGFDPDAVLYFNALVINGCSPELPIYSAVNAYIIAEKAAGNWGNQDMQYLLETADFCTASINIAQPSLYNITWNGSCSISVVGGLTGDSATCYGDTNVNHSGLTRLTQNNGHVELWSNGSVTATLGLISNAGGIYLLNALNKGTDVNSTNANAITDTGGGIAGLNFGDRTDSAHVTTGNNGVVQTNAGASTSAALVASHITVCQRNTGFCNSGAHIRFVGIGQAMPDEVSHYNNVRTLLTSLGGTGL